MLGPVKCLQLHTVHPFTDPACHISGLKGAHTYMPAESILPSPITKLLLILCLLDGNPFTLYILEWEEKIHEKRLKDFKFHTFIGHSMCAGYQT